MGMLSMSISAVYRMIVCAIFAGGFWIAFPDMAESSRGEAKPLVNDHEMVQAFAKANVKVAKIQTASAKKDGREVIDLNAPIDDLPKEKRIPTIQAIEAQGLTVAEYNKLLGAYKTNEDFRSLVVREILNLHPDPVDGEK
jgi:hypothetical protein